MKTDRGVVKGKKTSVDSSAQCIEEETGKILIYILCARGK